MAYPVLYLIESILPKLYSLLECLGIVTDKNAHSNVNVKFLQQGHY